MKIGSNKNVKHKNLVAKKNLVEYLNEDEKDFIDISQKVYESLDDSSVKEYTQTNTEGTNVVTAIESSEFSALSLENIAIGSLFSGGAVAIGSLSSSDIKETSSSSYKVLADDLKSPIKETISASEILPNATIAGQTKNSVFNQSSLHVEWCQTPNKLSIDDIDLEENSFKSGDYKGNFGYVNLTEDGYWYYIVDEENANVDVLTAGEILTDVVTVYSIDGTAQDLTITINGSNDEPIVCIEPLPSILPNATISGVIKDTVMESGSIEIAWMHAPNYLTIEDIDNGENIFKAGQYVGKYGSVDLSEDGMWFYGLDNENVSVDNLSFDETLTDVITVYSIDGTAQDLTITINGSNDEPMVCIEPLPFSMLSEKIIVSYKEAHTLDEVQADLVNLGNIAGLTFDSVKELGGDNSSYVLHISNDDSSLNLSVLNSAIEKLSNSENFNYVEIDQIFTLDPMEFSCVEEFTLDSLSLYDDVIQTDTSIFINSTLNESIDINSTTIHLMADNNELSTQSCIVMPTFLI